ncbi:MAG: rhomboid family intramembrane serine protease [Bacteroidota bacterium]
MLICPECLGELVDTATDHGYVWICAKCRAQCLNQAVLVKMKSEEFARRLSAQAREIGAPRRRPCPMCSNYMTEVNGAEGGEPVPLDFCAVCGTTWISARASEKLLPSPAPAAATPTSTTTPPPMNPSYAAMTPINPPSVALPSVGAAETAATAMPAAPAAPDLSSRIPALTQEQQDRIAAFYAQSATNQFNSKYAEKRRFAPESAWQRIAGYLGMPVKCDTQLSRPPATTWALTFFIAVVSLVAIFATDMRTTVGNLAFIPAQPFRHYGLTLLTCVLLHGGLFHLLSNSYFLFFFGDSVEDRIGGLSFLLLFLGSAVTGNFLHTFMDPNAEVPVIGASGGIAGVLAFYGLSFPRAKLAFYILFRIWIRLPALLFVLAWIGMQFFGARAQVAGFGDVSYLAHLGGVVMGIVFWLFWTLSGKEAKETGSGV